ncbi:hypothetical protein A1O3_08122 [Capronia epimyces CBS 606.96]|uniref:Uncharacterized protein n=1 Tax=Capronia epimyces CBS 606.96 TaxID=1182542 RepID=W9XH76_9EURO|nr:uncharacterized protein A1O3_08122 [Capronia epimyces CBS 606.96]EXJ79837.1 hypothetical protein A1O3_08122 [Capronia epimyces CBS 606.96]
MSDNAGFFKRTSEAVASAGASAAGAVSGSLSLGANASHKKTTSTKTRVPIDNGWQQGQQQQQQQQRQQPITNGAGQPAQGRITTGGLGEQKRLTDAQYEERMEDEYAKREGGA